MKPNLDSPADTNTASLVYAELAAKPKKRTTTPGTRALHVTISDEQFAALEESADGRPINVWLSKLVERHFKDFDLA